MLSAAYPFGRPEDERLKPSRRMHVMLQVRMYILAWYADEYNKQSSRYRVASLVACLFQSVSCLHGIPCDARRQTDVSTEVTDAIQGASSIC